MPKVQVVSPEIMPQVPIQEVKKLDKECHALQSQVSALKIRSTEDLNQAGMFLGAITSKIKAIQGIFKPIKQAQDAAKKVTLDQEKTVLRPWQDMEQSIRNESQAYLDEARRIEQKRLQEEARKHAEEEKARIEEEARLRKLELKKAATKGDTKKVLDLMEAQVEAEEELEVIREAPVATVRVADVAVQTSTMTTRSNWEWEPEGGGLYDLVKAAAKSPELLQFLSFNTSAVTSCVKREKDRTAIPGIRVFDRPSIVRR